LVVLGWYLLEAIIAHLFIFSASFTQGGFGLGLHFPGFPAESDWTKALGVFATEQPVWFGTILALICIAEGESVGHSGDNFRGKSTKEDQGNLNFDYLGIKQKVSAEKYARYQEVEIKVCSLIGFNVLSTVIKTHVLYIHSLFSFLSFAERTCCHDRNGFPFLFPGHPRIRPYYGYHLLKYFLISPGVALLRATQIWQFGGSL